MTSLGEDMSDDEVFMGKMTLKEVKKNIFLNTRHNRTLDITSQSQKPERRSIKIIETHSQPNLQSTSVTNTSPGSTHDRKMSSDSFIQMENVVAKLCISSEKVAELNTPLDLDDCILNNDLDQGSNQIVIKIEKPEDDIQMDQTIIEKEIKTEIELGNLSPGRKPKKENLPNLSPRKSPKKEIATPKPKINKMFQTSPTFYTPIKSPKQEADIFLTPSSNLLNAKTHIFKTPNSLNKPSVSSLRTSPSKSAMYKNIKSPIAKYIKGSIQAPLVTNVCPKKRLPGMGSLIPRLVKPQSKQDKENAVLPTTVYKTAKKKVIQHANEEKPKSQVAKKLLSTLPQPPVILKHEGRQFNSDRKPLCHLQEDSIADVSCAQADLSVCTLVKSKHK